MFVYVQLGVPAFRAGPIPLHTDGSACYPSACHAQRRRHMFRATMAILLVSTVIAHAEGIVQDNQITLGRLLEALKCKMLICDRGANQRKVITRDTCPAF